MIGGLIPKTTKSKREPPSTASAASVGFSSAPIRQPKAKTQPAPKIGGLIPTRDTAREDRGEPVSSVQMANIGFSSGIPNRQGGGLRANVPAPIPLGGLGPIVHQSPTVRVHRKDGKLTKILKG